LTIWHFHCFGRISVTKNIQSDNWQSLNIGEVPEMLVLSSSNSGAIKSQPSGVQLEDVFAKLATDVTLVCTRSRYLQCTWHL